MIRAFIVLLVIVLTIAMLLWTRPDTLAELQPLPPARVSTDVVKVMDIQPIVWMTGKLQPVRKSILQFEVSGRVVERLVEPGQAVKAGDILLRIDEGDFRDSVTEAEASWQVEKKAIERDRQLLKLLAEERELLEREVARLERLGQESLASKSNYEQAMQRLLQRRAEESRLDHSVDTATSRLENRLAILNTSRRNLERTKLKAPFNGRINNVSVVEGDYINSGQIAVEIVQLDSLDLYLEVTGDVAQQLSLGQDIKVNVDEKSITGKLIALAPDPDQETYTHAMRIRLSGDGIYPGQLAEAELPGKLLKGVNVIPLSAVMRDNGESFVFTVNDGKIHRQPVKLATRYQQWQVIQGISPGTKIVARDVSVLADGQEITIE